MADVNEFHYCVLCEWSGEIPQDAQQLTMGKSGGAAVFRFKDGTVHPLKRIKIAKGETSNV